MLVIVRDAADNEIAGVIKTYSEALCLHHNLMQISSGVEYALLGVLSVMRCHWVGVTHQLIIT